ncbi:MAG: M15 family metallopeptidase, partial [Actinomycetota bacterium]
MRCRLFLPLAVVALCASCQTASPSEEPVAAAPSMPSRSEPPEALPSPSPTRTDNPFVTARPAWLGERVLPRGDGIFAEALPTPPILRNRRFATIDILPPPKSRRFEARVVPVPDGVLARSSWRPECPVAPDELAY